MANSSCTLRAPYYRRYEYLYPLAFHPLFKELLPQLQQPGPDVPVGEVWVDEARSEYPREFEAYGDSFEGPNGKVYWRFRTRLDWSSPSVRDRFYRHGERSGQPSFNPLPAKPADVGAQLHKSNNDAVIEMQYFAVGEQHLKHNNGGPQFEDDDLRWMVSAFPTDQRQWIMKDYRQHRMLQRKRYGVRRRQPKFQRRHSMAMCVDPPERASGKTPLDMLNDCRHRALASHLSASNALLRTRDADVFRERKRNGGGIIKVLDGCIIALTDCGWGTKGERLGAVDARDHYLGMSAHDQAQAAMRARIGDPDFPHRAFLSDIYRALSPAGFSDRMIHRIGVPLSMLASTMDEFNLSLIQWTTLSGAARGSVSRASKALRDAGVIVNVGESNYGFAFRTAEQFGPEIHDLVMDSMVEVATNVSFHHLEYVVSMATGGNNGAMPFEWSTLYLAAQRGPVTIDDLVKVWGYQRRTVRKLYEQGLERGLWSMDRNGYLVPAQVTVEKSREVDRYSTRRQDRRILHWERQRARKAAWEQKKLERAQAEMSVVCTDGPHGSGLFESAGADSDSQGLETPAAGARHPQPPAFAAPPPPVVQPARDFPPLSVQPVTNACYHVRTVTDTDTNQRHPHD